MNPTSSRPKLVVTADGTGVVSHAGARLLADLAEATRLACAPRSRVLVSNSATAPDLG